jgi:uncharacterized protein
VHVVALRFDLHIPMAQSLKAKRSVVRPVVDGLRHRFHVSVSEVDHHDRWQRAAIGVVLVAESHRHLEELTATVERFVYAAPDLEVVDVERTYLS